MVCNLTCLEVLELELGVLTPFFYTYRIFLIFFYATESRVNELGMISDKKKEPEI